MGRRGSTTGVGPAYSRFGTLGGSAPVFRLSSSGTPGQFSRANFSAVSK
jgi:hypothetical protein